MGTRWRRLALLSAAGKCAASQSDKADSANIKAIIDKNLAKEGMLMTDEASSEFKHHSTVEHGAGRYACGPVHVNTLEGYFSIFKRGMKGIYRHCSEKHLHRYLAEFDFRCNNRIAKGVDDVARTQNALLGVKGKRRTY